MPEKSHLEQLSKPILKIILEYLEITTGFYFIRQNTALYTVLRRPLTEVAYGQYARILLLNNHPVTPTTLVTDLLPRFTAFLRAPLVVDEPFPDLPILFLPDPLVILRSSQMDYTSGISEAQIITMLRRMVMINYDSTEDDHMKTCWINRGQQYGLPISYSPSLGLLKLYPPSGSPDDGLTFHQHVRLPLLLIFTNDQGTIRIEHVVKWLGIEWQYSTNTNLPLMAGLIAWISDDWIVRILIDHDGVVQAITVHTVDPYDQRLGTFQTFDNGHSYEVFNRDPSFCFNKIQAFYYPTTLLLKKDPIIFPNNKCCCNIV